MFRCSIPGLAAAILCLSVSCMATAAEATLAAVAQSAAVAHPPADADSVVTLSEISVTAVKQQGGLRELPISASSLSTDALQLLDATDIKRVSGIVPNFYMPAYGSRITSSIYVRGIGARMDQPAVGLNIDNVPVLNKDAYDLDLADIASIELLRGPQSSLYGRNTMTGLINISTLSPMTTRGWRAMLQGSSGSTLKGSLGWYHKFSPDLAFSVNGGFLFSRGRYRNDCNGRLIDKERSGALRTKLQWQSASGFRVQNVLATSILRQGGYPYAYIPTGRIAYNDTCFYRRFLLSDGLTLAWRSGSVEFTSVTSLQHISDNMTLDQDFLPLPYFVITQRKHETSVTEDFMARGTALAGKYSWLGGAFLFFRHLDMKAPVTFKEAGIEKLIVDHRNTGNPYYPVRWESQSFPLNSDFAMPTFGTALYHESRFELGPWRLAAGIRLDFERASMRYYSYCSTGYDIMQNPSGLLPAPADAPFYRHVAIDIDESGRLHKDFLTLLPRISALYNLPSSYAFNGNVYAVVGRGYKAGGFNTQMFSDVLQQRLMNIMGIGSTYNVEEIVSYKPEHCWSYEAGAHLGVADDLFTADISLFYIDVTDQQLTRFPDGITTGRVMTNAGKTRSYGLEASLCWRPRIPWVFNASYGYTNARFREFSDGKADYKGKHLPYAPGNTIWFQALYTLHAPALRHNVILLDADMRAAGPIYWNEANTRRQKTYFLLGASATFRAPKWEVQIWGRNLSDTRYDTFYFLSMGNEFLQRGERISAGVTLRLSLD